MSLARSPLAPVEEPYSISGAEVSQLTLATFCHLGSSTPVRLRMSELDYSPYRDGTSTVAPAAVNTAFRRPFFAHIPVNRHPPKQRQPTRSSRT